jgi:uncharacterized protein YgiM (DUF1202 family)
VARDKEVGKTTFSKVSFPFLGEVNVERLNVRALPNSTNKSTIITILSMGDHVVVVGKRGGFYRIIPPKGAWVWVHRKYLKVGKDGATITKKAPLMIDSRFNAKRLGYIKPGNQVKILKDHLGWYKIKAPAHLRFWVAKRYISFIKQLKPSEVPGFESTEFAKKDILAREKMAQAEQLIKEQNKLIMRKEFAKIDLLKIATLYEEASKLACDPDLKRYASDNARLYKKMHGIVVAIKGPLVSLEEQVRKLDEIIEKSRIVSRLRKTFTFTGYIDTTGALLRNRPGTHKLMKDGKIVCFLKTSNPRIINKLNDNYQKFVGVRGSIIRDPEGWTGYCVVIVEDVVPISSDEDVIITGE